MTATPGNRLVNGGERAGAADVPEAPTRIACCTFVTIDAESQHDGEREHA